ncbi:hypothetical protein JCM14244_11120 [Venenivibrio stagnispumantis]|uniref:Lipoprotein n=1 Tax=Venenivibrio stagnispumantis TaxID=407998 RepID=A0AA45WNB2_9AQUI|nr:hypothetical protein [Venenivibrio stagnispumantis]MCW4573175.1 hypothetical protein [Venenivibrio stagnispumantis]SMP17825.1 hypothetical protein SAMN06264868_11645 [Venenivibrio stagnispumantis]
MKKYVLKAVALSTVAVFALTSCANYATKEYVDQQFGAVNSKLDSLETKVSNLEKEVANAKAANKAEVEALKSKVANLESEISAAKNSCPTACEDKINKLERDVDALKEKIQKSQSEMEKEMENKARK